MPLGVRCVTLSYLAWLRCQWLDCMEQDLGLAVTAPKRMSASVGVTQI